MKKLIRVLVVILVVLALAIAGVLGFLWYRNNHIFVEDAVYPIRSESLDLREEDISVEHYEAVRAQLPNCEIRWNVPFQGARYPDDTQNISVNTLTEEDVVFLKTYLPKLQKVDAMACHDYAVLEYLCEQNTLPHYQNLF